MILRSGSLTRRPNLPALQRGGGTGGAARSSLPGAADEETRALGASRRLSLDCAGVQALPATPTRDSPSALPPSSPAGRSAHTGAPARGRAGGGGRCCRCRSPSLSRRDRPRCCGLGGRFPLSLWPELSPPSPQSGGAEEDEISLCWGFQAARCCCAPSRRLPAEDSRSRWVHAGPYSADKSWVHTGGRARQLQPKRARSLKSVPSAANFPGSPSPRRSLRQPWERCAPSRAAHPLPTRHPWDRLPSAARLGALSLHGVQGSGARSPRCFADPARQSAGVPGGASVQTPGCPQGIPCLFKDFPPGTIKESILPYLVDHKLFLETLLTTD
ncbi:hypothetical protein J0S82_020149 [Galemys pyrenaicus]|uniref:Uncharacterized protein n=1 Tax=Galemys pyrenaicus TaxID=202257 RepID=A0A8J6AN37_GALPY|nr:hypothetical protein J0S82_020149 [Galemys pyrenaicus]